MLCVEFEDRLTDYIEGALDSETNRTVAEHALRCPVCHDLLNEVKATLATCQLSEPEPPARDLTTRIIMTTVPELVMTCGEFEEHLTDYLDGYLPASQYHRWERHAALCETCTELPGIVVRTIGSCYSYISESVPVPEGLHGRILELTIGTANAREVKAPFWSRIADRLRFVLDPIVSPQLATVATMVLVAVLVLTSTVSSDGSINGMYQASLLLAEKTYGQSSSTADRGNELRNRIREFSDGLTSIVVGSKPGSANKNQNQQPQNKQEKKDK